MNKQSPIDKQIDDFLINEQLKYFHNKVDTLIAEEMIIAQTEGQPTSRLTSLATKIDDFINVCIRSRQKGV